MSSIKAFIKKFNELIQSNDLKNITHFCHHKKTLFLVEKIKQTDPKTFQSLHAPIISLINQGKISIIEQLLLTGLDISCSPRLSIELFNEMIKCHKKLSFTLITLFQLFVAHGFDMNQLRNEGSGNYVSPVHKTLIEIKKQANQFRFEGKGKSGTIYESGIRKLTFFNDNEEYDFIKNNVLYYLLMHMKKEGIKVEQFLEKNLITLAIETKSKSVITAMLTIDAMTEEYVQKGIKEVQEKNIYSTQILEFVMTEYEKTRLESLVAKTKSNQEKKIKI